MSKFAEQFLSIAKAKLERIRNEEMPALREAASLMAETIINGGRIFAFGCSHSALPVSDIVSRAGGLVLINPIYAPALSGTISRPPTLGSAMEKLTGYAEIILNNTPIQKNDVLIIVSLSGRNAVPIEMAQLAKERGIKVIGVTAKAYTEAVASRHPSGKKMIDFADVVLDNKADKGDAVLEDPRMPQKFIPVSGVTSCALLQSLVAATSEELLNRGFTPPVLLSANLDGGREYNNKIVKEYKDRIFFY